MQSLKTQNSKSEIRNNFECTNVRKEPSPLITCFEFSFSLIRACFEFRYSRFGFLFGGLPPSRGFSLRTKATARQDGEPGETAVPWILFSNCFKLFPNCFARASRKTLVKAARQKIGRHASKSPEQIFGHRRQFTLFTASVGKILKLLWSVLPGFIALVDR